MQKIIKVMLLVRALIGTIAWAVLAIYFGDSSSSIVRTSASTVFGLFGLVTVIGLSFGVRTKLTHPRKPQC
jgi:TRAP-type C4-dicarboxylate transport system permease small subunit